MRIGAGALGVLEHEGGVESHLAHEGERLGVILECLVVETAEDIRADGCSRQDAPDSSDTV